MTTMQCTATEANEWYDGLVQGQVWFDHLLFYAILLAWDFDKCIKIYLIFPISPEALKLIDASYDNAAAWADVESLLRRLVDAGPSYLTQETPTAGKTLNLRKTEKLSSEQLCFEKFTIEQAISQDALQKWIN